MRRQIPLFLLSAALLLMPLTRPQPAQAVTILFEATDLGDTTPGDDLWQYTYLVSDFSFPADFGFSVFFDPILYTGLEDPPPFVNADWDIIALQPDPFLPDDGLYDALALVNNASLANPFTVSFVWLGGIGTTPGAQPFAIFDESFQTVAAGTTAPVPEPGTLVLLGTGLASLIAIRKRLQNRRGE